MTYPNSPGFKERGRTSEEASARINGRAANLRAKLLQLYRKNASGLSADRAAGLLGESILAIRPRVSELGKAGLLVKTSRLDFNDSGRRAVIWALSSNGKA